MNPTKKLGEVLNSLGNTLVKQGKITSSEVPSLPLITSIKSDSPPPEKKYKLDESKKQPPTMPIKSIQYDFFSQFVSNDRSEMSNTVELWESIPKYFLNSKQQEKLRIPTGHADPYEWEYSYNGKIFMVKIQPSLLKQENGNYKAFFPSATEELIEEVLKKTLADQQHGIHDPAKAETWVKFSLSMIQKGLKARGRERNRKEIKQAIEVMSSCVITLYNDGKEVWKGAILQDLVTVNRSEYEADTDSLHAARLPLFISHAINSLDYRQFNYDRLMGCDEPLTRWIYKRLINRFKQASLLNNYHFMYSDIKQGSGFLQQGREIDNRRKVVSSMKELVKEEILDRYEVNERKEGRKIIDVKYTIHPSMNFIREQKAANKRVNDQLTTARRLGVRTVDNSH